MGIYRFYNPKENKSYIGQSVQLKKRYSQHFKNYKNKNDHSYYTNFYKALRKFGFFSFDYEVLEEKDFYTREELNERERFWVDHYDSYTNGYNMNSGGVYVTEVGENHPMAKLTEKEVLEIKYKLKECSFLSQKDIGEEYNTSQSVISEINNGLAWTTVGDSDFPIRKQSKSITGSSHFASKLSDSEVLSIRKRYVYETGKQIYQDYKDKISYVSFEKLLRGKTYFNLPIYKKAQKKWIEN